MFEKRINMFTGHFGSGKTEVAVNFAFRLSDIYERVAIVDFDIVNPYFRAVDARQKLEKRGICVIAPLFANTNIDIPALPPEINTLFENKEYRVVFDVGGDDIGAKALSRYRDSILKDEYEMYVVINTKRPMTDTVEKIMRMIAEIEASSRLKATKLVNNTNLLKDTSPEDIIRGYELINTVSYRLGIEIAFTSVFPGIADGIEGKVGTEILRLYKYIKLPWDYE